MDFLLQMDVVILLVNSLAVNVFRSGRESLRLEHDLLRILITVFFLFSTVDPRKRLGSREKHTNSK